MALGVIAGPSQAGGPGGPVPPQFLADQLTLSQPGGAHYAHHITKCHPGFSDLATGLFIFDLVVFKILQNFLKNSDRRSRWLVIIGKLIIENLFCPELIFFRSVSALLW